MLGLRGSDADALPPVDSARGEDGGHHGPQTLPCPGGDHRLGAGVGHGHGGAAGGLAAELIAFGLFLGLGLDKNTEEVR